MAISLDTRIIPLGNTKSNLGILGEKIKRKAVRVRGDYSGITGIALDLGRDRGDRGEEGNLKGNNHLPSHRRSGQTLTKYFLLV